MYKMSYDIQIGNFKVKNLMDVEVRKSANKLTDTATIKMVGMSENKALEVESKIKRGDQVNIKLGYNTTLHQEFLGYVSSIATDNTITIECEDGMFLYRKEVENKQYKKITVVDLITQVASQLTTMKVVAGPGTDIVKYDKFTVNNATAFDVFKKIQEETKLQIFVKGNELHVHLKFTYNEGKVNYDFSKNVEKSSLKFVKEEDKKVLVEVVGIKRNNEKTTVIVGDKGGDKTTIHRYNVSDKSALQKIGEEELKKHRYTGYEGSITGWLFPYITYGYSAEIFDRDYPARKGIYYTEAVKTRFNKSGGSRQITLGILLT